MPYPKNFVVRLIICVVGMVAIWIGVRFVMSTLIFHEEFILRPIHIIMAVALGVVEAFVWKPKENK